MRLYRLPRAALAASASFLLSGPASAHHFMGGRAPATFAEGFLSGIAHPVIGPEHLAFLIAVGVVIGVWQLNLALASTFLTAMAVGVAVHVGGINVPAVEIGLALFVLLAGFLIATGRALSVLSWSALFVAAGLLQGYAFGESIYGAERSPLAAYLLGLVVVQTALTIGIALIARRLHLTSFGARLVGAAIAGIGFTVAVGQVIPGA